MAAGTRLRTRCSLRCLVWAEGLIQTPASRSNIYHFAPSTSPRRAPVSSISLIA